MLWLAARRFSFWYWNWGGAVKKKPPCMFGSKNQPCNQLLPCTLRTEGYRPSRRGSSCSGKNIPSTRDSCSPVNIYVLCVLKERAIYLYLRGSTDGIKMGLFYIVLGRVKTLNQLVWNKNPTCWILHFDHSTHSAEKSSFRWEQRKIDLPVYVAEVEECLSFWLPWNG